MISGVADVAFKFTLYSAYLFSVLTSCLRFVRLVFSTYLLPSVDVLNDPLCMLFLVIGDLCADSVNY